MKQCAYLVSLFLLSSRRHAFGAFTVTISSSISDKWASVIAHTFSWSIIILVALSQRPSFRSNNSCSWTKRYSLIVKLLSRKPNRLYACWSDLGKLKESILTRVSSYCTLVINSRASFWSNTSPSGPSISCVKIVSFVVSIELLTKVSKGSSLRSPWKSVSSSTWKTRHKMND